MTGAVLVCDPGPFMRGVVDALKDLGFLRARRHQKKFVSLGGSPFGDETFMVDDGDDPGRGHGARAHRSR